LPDTYRVHLQKDSLVFSAAHFITFAGNQCERLHGHNYGVWVEVEAPLDDNQYVIDFIFLRDTMQEIVTALDHHVLLPAEHPTIKVTVESGEVQARFEQRRWLFPREDCVILPVANTTAELLAKYLADQLLARLDQQKIHRPVSLRMGVDENNGQWAIYEWSEQRPEY
jgi:6-pyruvoyltetrahydropterin/6-carboxytetrahydropterin synthase